MGTHWQLKAMGDSFTTGRNGDSLATEGDRDSHFFGIILKLFICSFRTYIMYLVVGNDQIESHL